MVLLKLLIFNIILDIQLFMWTPFLIVSGVALSVALISINKSVINQGFCFPTIMTTFHFFMTFLLLKIMVHFHFFEDKPVPTIETLKLSIANVAAIVLKNYNLQFNSVGFYQLSKLGEIPILVFYKRIIKGIKISGLTLLSLTIIIIGMGIFSVNDVLFNWVGFIFALSSIICACFSQTLAHQIQNQYDIGGTQLTYRISLLELILGIIASLIFETFFANGIIHTYISKKAIILLISSGFVAVLVNCVSYAMLGKVGPISFQVIGHMKNILIFVFSIIFFPIKETTKQLCLKVIGLIISISGAILYTYTQIKESQEHDEEESEIIDNQHLLSNLDNESQKSDSDNETIDNDENKNVSKAKPYDIEIDSDDEIIDVDPHIQALLKTIDSQPDIDSKESDQSETHL